MICAKLCIYCNKNPVYLMGQWECFECLKKKLTIKPKYRIEFGENKTITLLKLN